MDKWWFIMAQMNLTENYLWNLMVILAQRLIWRKQNAKLMTTGVIAPTIFRFATWSIVWDNLCRLKKVWIRVCMGSINKGKGVWNYGYGSTGTNVGSAWVKSQKPETLFIRLSFYRYKQALGDLWVHLQIQSFKWMPIQTLVQRSVLLNVVLNDCLKIYWLVQLSKHSVVWILLHSFNHTNEDSLVC